MARHCCTSCQSQEGRTQGAWLFFQSLRSFYHAWEFCPHPKLTCTAMLNTQLLPLIQNLWSHRFNEKPSRGTDVRNLWRFYSTVDGHWKNDLQLQRVTNTTDENKIFEATLLFQHFMCPTVNICHNWGTVRPYAQEFPFFRQHFFRNTKTAQPLELASAASKSTSPRKTDRLVC